MKKIIALLTTILLVDGCGSVGPIATQEAGPYPASYKELVKEYIYSAYKDPHSLRDVYISKPTPYRILEHRGYVVCLKSNAKNSFGGYVGQESNELMIESSGNVWATGAVGCNPPSMERWIEMEEGK